MQHMFSVISHFSDNSIEDYVQLLILYKLSTYIISVVSGIYIYILFMPIITMYDKIYGHRVVARSAEVEHKYDFVYYSNPIIVCL